MAQMRSMWACGLDSQAKGLTWMELRPQRTCNKLHIGIEIENYVCASFINKYQQTNNLDLTHKLETSLQANSDNQLSQTLLHTFVWAFKAHRISSEVQISYWGCKCVWLGSQKTQALLVGSTRELVRGLWNTSQLTVYIGRPAYTIKGDKQEAACSLY